MFVWAQEWNLEAKSRSRLIGFRVIKAKFSLELLQGLQSFTKIIEIVREDYFTPDPFGIAVSSTNR